MKNHPESFFTLAMGVLIAPLAFIKCSIRILTDTPAVKKVIDPLSLILRAIFMKICSVTLSFTHVPIPKVVRLVSLLAETKAIL